MSCFSSICRFFYTLLGIEDEQIYNLIKSLGISRLINCPSFERLKVISQLSVLAHLDFSHKKDRHARRSQAVPRYHPSLSRGIERVRESICKINVKSPLVR